MNQPPKNLTILPPSEMPAVTPPDAFREDRVLYDLARLAHSPGLFQTYIERARVRFTKAAEMAVLERWISFYQAGGRLIEARLEMERRKNEFLEQASERANERQAKAKGREAAMVAHEADIAESKLRRDMAEYKRQNLDRFVEGGRPEPPAPRDVQPKLTADQQRRLKRMEVEDKLRELDRLEEEALKAARGDQDRVRVQNMYADKREELREQLAKNLI